MSGAPPNSPADDIAGLLSGRMASDEAYRLQKRTSSKRQEKVNIGPAFDAMQARMVGSTQIHRAPDLSLREYIREGWHVVEPATPFIPNWHIDVIAEHLEACTNGQIRNLLINIPPRCAKSLVVAVFWPTWEWHFRPHTRWLYSSYGEVLSTRDSLKCRRTITSSWYQGRWASRYQLTGDMNLKTRFENDRTGYRIATSVGGVGTGEGGDRIVVDDPHKVDEAESDDVRTGVTTWWRETMSTRFNDPKTGVRVVVMQRIHEADLSGELIEEGSYHHLCLPMEWEPPVYISGTTWHPKEPQPHVDCAFGADPRQDKGDLLWPDRFGQDEIIALKRQFQSTYAVSGQLQQRPVPREGAMFRSDWFRPFPEYFAKPDYEGHTVRDKLTIVQFWDLAFKEKETADWTACVTMGVDASQNMYILDVYRTKVDEIYLPQVMAEHIATHRAHVVGVEEGAYKQAATRDIVRLATKELAGRWAASLVPVPVTTDKKFRAQLPASRAQAGYIYADKRAHWWEAFESEMLKFPLGRNDDQVDALSGAVALAVTRGQVANPRQQRRNKYRLGRLGKSQEDLLQQLLR